ncbi:hypothetical protein AZH43_15555 [Acinetobacter pragensis]|uniref:Uncharacterized protein n=1 Tax=Acinetobacter pragensis TaxID=1806892 RepID=A0A151XZT7_9GAMM|nr:hypothetical protein AZH43_15555 [Acinetobacter pragensis]
MSNLRQPHEIMLKNFYYFKIKGKICAVEKAEDANPAISWELYCATDCKISVFSAFYLKNLQSFFTVSLHFLRTVAV